MIVWTSARNPAWGDQGRTFINLLVTFDPGGELPFAAAPFDIEPHGRDIFKRAVDGEFGPIADYVITPDIVLDQVSILTAKATDKINILSVEAKTLQDSIDLGMSTPEEEERLPLVESELTEWKRYRVMLSRVTSQPGFPGSVTLPTPPA